MSKVLVSLGNKYEVFVAKDVRFLEGDMVCVVDENGDKWTTHKQNIVILEEAEKVDRCVSCGEVVPEGKMVCPNCEGRTPFDAMLNTFFGGRK